MCRLYGFLANEPTKVDCSLVFAQNAMLLQSRADEIGRDHADGWGIATWKDGKPNVVKRALAAFEDASFSSTAERTYTKCMIAHVRRATVGLTDVENTHPFSFGTWVFAHNGTVTGFDALRCELESETTSDIQVYRRGSTDSEQYFLWLISKLELARHDMRSHDRAIDRQEIAEIEAILFDCVVNLARRSQMADSTKTPKLNFILSNGHVLFACRWNNSLHWIQRHGIYEGEICGIPHIHHHETIDHKAVAFASEPITNETWSEFPNKSVKAFCL